jgi:hypothetical protein
MGRDVQESLVHLHPSHPQNDINALTFQNEEVGRKDLPALLEWDFMDHTINNYSTSRCKNKIWHFCVLEG